jgi:hypothetical protein
MNPRNRAIVLGLTGGLGIGICHFASKLLKRKHNHYYYIFNSVFIGLKYFLVLGISGEILYRLK